MRTTRRALTVIALVTAMLVCGQTQGQQPRPPKSRAVSLTVFQGTLRSSLASGKAPPQLLELCGLTRVEGYVLDRANRDLVLLGQVDPAAPPLHTEDLVIALRSAWLKYAWKEGKTRYYDHPGCSIDPDPAVVRRLSQIGAQIGGAASAEQMEDLLAQWCQASKQPQKVRVKGVPVDSHFASVMVTADYDLKRLVDGSVTLQTAGLTSMVDRMMEAAKDDVVRGRPLRGPANSLSRFWFFPGQAKYGLDGDTVTLLQCPVILLTEEEYLSESGLAGKGRPEANARQFADSFSARYAAVAREQPIYQELDGLFRFVTLAKLMKYQRVKVDLRYFLDRFPVPKVATPRTLPGLCRVKQFEQYAEGETGRQTSHLWMPSCGGVSMEVKIKPTDFVKPKRPASSGRGSATPGKRGGKSPGPSGTAPPARRDGRAALKSRPSPQSLYWDY